VALRREIVSRPEGLFAPAEWPLLAGGLDGDAPTRLVYADLLEESGDERGAFLRLAMRGERTALLARQRALEETAEGWLWLRLLGLTFCLFPFGGGRPSASG
jgi:uncharacterized protein (TIGR02996 family)